MNKMLLSYGKEYLLENLPKCSEKAQNMFRAMYGRDNGKRSYEDAMKMSLEEVISEMTEDRVDWAMSQVQNTLNKKP